MTDTTVSDGILKTGGALDGGVGESIFGDRAEGRLIGRHVGNIRIVEFIGAGGMGEVYLGMDERLDRNVAVKSLKPGLRVSEDVRNRFYREARILSRLDHPSICRLYDLVDSTDRHQVRDQFVNHGRIVLLQVFNQVVDIFPAQQLMRVDLDDFHKMGREDSGRLHDRVPGVLRPASLAGGAAEAAPTLPHSSPPIARDNGEPREMRTFLPTLSDSGS